MPHHGELHPVDVVEKCDKSGDAILLEFSLVTGKVGACDKLSYNSE